MAGRRPIPLEPTATARRQLLAGRSPSKRDDAKALLAKTGRSIPASKSNSQSIVRPLNRPFGEWIDEWLAEKKTEKIRRGKLVTVRSATTTSARTVGRLFEGSFRQALPERHQTSRRAGLFPVDAMKANWKPATGSAASANRSATGPTSKATATIHSVPARSNSPSTSRHRAPASQKQRTWFAFSG